MFSFMIKVYINHFKLLTCIKLIVETQRKECNNCNVMDIHFRAADFEFIREFIIEMFSSAGERHHVKVTFSRRDIRPAILDILTIIL